ncbi:MAG TPA: spore coat protein U domain-containing protein [Geopsychrobacteraceae bacterium]|nr:spore coat protein U domain-containing protein [Geopsychrobacteraceae bacterium]
MKRLGLLLLTALIWLIPLQMVAVGGGTSTLTVSATILSKSKCRFVTKNPILDFGLLDPSNAITVNASVMVSIVCNGSVPIASYLMSDDGGLDTYKMTHDTDPTQKIPYSLSLTPASGNVPKGVNQDVVIGGSILGGDYQTANIGTYTDSVILTLLP